MFWSISEYRTEGVLQVTDHLERNMVLIPRELRVAVYQGDIGSTLGSNLDSSKATLCSKRVRTGKTPEINDKQL